jgi:hypothetical protein
LAGETQAVVERAAAELFVRNVHLERRNSVKISSGGLETVSSHLLREMLMLVWRKLEWPQQAMGFEEWSILETMLRETLLASPKAGKKRIFPGGIEVESVLGEMRISPQTKTR